MSEQHLFRIFVFMWHYKNSPLQEDDIPNEAIGFVYFIDNVSKRKFYIGKKNLHSTRKVKFGKKEIAKITDKRLKHYKMETKESNWREYNGSNKPLLADIANGDHITKNILEFAYNKQQLTYLETKWLFSYDALETKNCYNDNILGKFYKSKVNAEQ